jgi:hypothetical protein
MDYRRLNLFPVSRPTPSPLRVTAIFFDDKACLMNTVASVNSEPSRPPMKAPKIVSRTAGQPALKEFPPEFHALRKDLLQPLSEVVDTIAVKPVAATRPAHTTAAILNGLAGRWTAAIALAVANPFLHNLSKVATDPVGVLLALPLVSIATVFTGLNDVAALRTFRKGLKLPVA